MRSKPPAFGGRFHQARRRRPFDPATGWSTIFDVERQRERRFKFENERERERERDGRGYWERDKCRRSSVFYSTLPRHSYSTRFFQFLFILFYVFPNYERVFSFFSFFYKFFLFSLMASFDHFAPFKIFIFFCIASSFLYFRDTTLHCVQYLHTMLQCLFCIV